MDLVVFYCIYYPGILADIAILHTLRLTYHPFKTNHKLMENCIDSSFDLKKISFDEVNVLVKVRLEELWTLPL